MAIINLSGCISDSCGVVQLLLMTFSAIFMSSTSYPVRNESGTTVFLEKYAYPNESVTHRSKEVAVQSEDALTQELKKFQRFSDIKQRDTLGRATQAIISIPRADAENESSNSIFIRRKRYVLQGSKWSRMPVTFRVSKYSKRFKDNVKIDNVIRKAFKVWSDVSSLEFEDKRRGRVDIDIRFEVGDHGDDTSFDKSGNILAHAFFPQFGGDVHFDDDRTWTIDDTNGVSLFHVAAHEFGHALGLSHSEDRTALMFQHYPASDPLLELQPDDIEAIQERYGPPGNPIIEEPGSIPDTSNAPDMCTNAKIDAATRTQDGSTYFFKGAFYWKIDPNTVVDGYPKRIADGWDGLESNLDAAFTWASGKTFFFKGGKYWRFTNTNMDLGYPKWLSEGFAGIPDAPDAAFVWSGNGATYFFKDKQYWLFDGDKNPPVSNKYPKSIKNWRGLPDDGIDAALHWENQRTYFFKGKKFYRFDDDKFEVESASPPYPRSISAWWFHCSPIS